MKDHGRKKTNADDELFEKEMVDVRRLRHRVAERPSPRRLPSTSGGSVPHDISNEIGDLERFLRPGMQQSAWRKLRRSQISHAATLDLHGYNAAEARKALVEFVGQSQRAGKKTIRVVHGKGHGSAGSRPVLKLKVREWLREFPAVLAF